MITDLLRLPGVALLCALLAGCERPPVHSNLREAELPALIAPYEFVFRRGGLDRFSFSPDGSRLAWHAPHGLLGRRSLHVRNADGSIHRYRTGGSAMIWSADSRRMLILDDKSGAENYRLYRLDLDDPHAQPVDLTPYPGVRVWLYRILDNDPEHVLILHNRRDRTVRDLYRINLSTGNEELVAANPGDGILPVVAANGNFLGWRKSQVAKRARNKPRPEPEQQRSALSRESEDIVRLVGVAADRTRAWVLSNRGRDRVSLIAVDTPSGRARLLYEDPHGDIARVATSNATGEPLAVTVQADYPRTHVLDSQLAADLEPLLGQYKQARFGYEIVSTDRADRRVIVALYTHGARRYYLLDRERKTHVLLGSSRKATFEQSLTVPQAVAFQARDGLTIPAYLLRPPGLDRKPLPLVVLVHGGPWARVAWTDLDHSEDLLHAQFLVNRGYAVLAINFRGSTGYGRAFMTAAVGEMGRKMQDDLFDGVRWAVEHGIADPHAVALFGYSYGGYATLMALVQQPQMFSCGVDIAGPTDLARLIETFPPYWELELDHWYRYVGDPAVAVDREGMQQVSPLAHVQQIRRPLLVIHGQNDVRVPPEQSARLVEALRGLGRSVEYVTLPDMGHSLGYWAHHLQVLRSTETFLANCLGGRAARFDPLQWIARLTGRLPLRQ